MFKIVAVILAAASHHFVGTAMPNHSFADKAECEVAAPHVKQALTAIFSSRIQGGAEVIARCFPAADADKLMEPNKPQSKPKGTQI